MYKIKENIDIIKSKIEETHKNSNFAKLPVPKLIAVSKKQSEDKVIEALEAGQKYFGENRVQEAQQRWASKIQQYKDLQIRLIGPLQTNKVKQALGFFEIRSMVAALEAADAMLKAADVSLRKFEVVGSGVISVIIEGEVAAVQAAIESAELSASHMAEVISINVIPSPNKELLDLFE